MASGDDPLADMQNLLGYAGLVGNNPYSPFQNAIPFSGGAGPGVGYIAGMPTQAWSGQPIQMPPGMTLNSTPAQPAAPAAAPAAAPSNVPTADYSAGLFGHSSLAGTGAGSGTPDLSGNGGGLLGFGITPGTGSGSSSSAAAAAPSTNNAGLTRQQYLQLLANPGPLPTYGAAGPQAGQTATGTPPPNVLASFLNANQGKNSSFLNTLRGLQPGATS